MIETTCDVMEQAYRRNWITSRDGNASIRYAAMPFFSVTPSGVRKQLLQPAMFKRVDCASGATLDHVEPLQMNLVPSGELPLHYGLQKQIPEGVETRVVLHLHPTYTVAAMYRGLELSKLTEQFPELGRYTSVAPNVPNVPPISQELADLCHANLELDENGNTKFDIVGIDRHGVVAIATTPWRAMEHVERLEHICKIVLASQKYGD